MTLLTFGHGTATQPQIIELLTGAKVEELVDIRTAPGSRHNPHVGRAELTRWLPEAGIGYRWEPRLGGFRRLAADVEQSRRLAADGQHSRQTADDSPDTVWRNASFRAFAGYTRDPEFSIAVDDLLDGAARRRTTVMCSETVWWRCHRRIVADFVVVARNVRVEHLMHDGRLTPHTPTEGVRLRDDGLLVYDSG